MKRNWTCPKCGSLKVGYLESLEDQGEHAGQRKIGQAPVGQFLGLTAYQAYGDVEAFVCTECGYFEEYVKSPQNVQWATLKGFRWCRPELAGPG